MRKKFVAAIITLFVVLTVALYMLSINAPAYKMATLMTGNIVMLVLTLTSFFIVTKQLNGNPQAFVRGVSGASFLKLMICMISILTYIMLDKEHLHKPTIFILLGIYAIYTIVETWQLSRLAKQTQ